MADETDSTSTQGSRDDVLQRALDAINDHKNHTKDELAKLARDLRDELTSAHKESSDATAKEIRELKEALQDITGFVSEQREAAKNRDRVTESESTIVVPPNDVIPQPPAEPEEEHSYGPSDDGDSPKKGLLKRLW